MKIQLIVTKHDCDVVSTNYSFIKRNYEVISSVRHMARQELEKWTGGDFKIEIIDTGEE